MTQEELENALREFERLSEKEYHEPATAVALGPEDEENAFCDWVV